MDQQINQKPEPRTKEIPLPKPKRTHGTRRGLFTPKNPEKYEGDLTNIVYRSGIELRLMKYLDDQPSVLKWSSEETVIPYISPIDKRMHRYYVDFKVTTKTRDGNLVTRLVEVKWSTATRPPVPPKNKKRSRRYFEEQKAWIVNQAKWETAKIFCEKRGWDWQILTEKQLTF